MNTTAIIAEYNPFHNGHIHHIHQARKQSGCDLLIAVMSVMSLREWLYIFGAVSVLLAFAAGMCREIKARIKKDVEENAALAAETATGESVDAGVAFPMAEGGESEAAETAGAEDTAEMFAAEPADTAPPAEEE